MLDPKWSQLAATSLVVDEDVGFIDNVEKVLPMLSHVAPQLLS